MESVESPVGKVVGKIGVLDGSPDPIWRAGSESASKGSK